MAKKIHRDVKLDEEIYFVVLRLLQLRDNYNSDKSIFKVQSIKYNGIELAKNPRTVRLNLENMTPKQAKAFCEELGYVRRQRGQKADITINNKLYAIRCLDFTDRALINHTNRAKFKQVCEYLDIDISTFDQIIQKYWSRRRMQVFNEDCYYDSTLNPFVDHKEYLKDILTFMAFHTLNYRKSIKDEEFVKERIDFILDFRRPYDESTWSFYSPQNYFESIWTSLCFSMRDNKGMPSDEVLFEPENADVIPWVFNMGGKNKGALHIRIKKYDASEKKGVSFYEMYKEQIEKAKENVGERDEYLLKLFLIDCREKSCPVPLGREGKWEIVRSVGTKTEEFGKPRFVMQWATLSAEELVYVCSTVKAVKAGAYSKADVYINHIGVSVKSNRGSSPSIINHTTREKILRVMRSVGQPIAPLDKIVGDYWKLRLAGTITEDVVNSNPLSPFVVGSSGLAGIEILKPLLNYFAFDGTGTRDSQEPAELILSMDDPFDCCTWVYYDKVTFIDSVWEKLRFSIRAKSTPQKLDTFNTAHQAMKPWIKKVDGKNVGALSVRVDK